MFYHRSTSIDLPEAIRADVIQDMATYGYLLPAFTPLLTRYMCRQAALSIDGVVIKSTIGKIKLYVA